MKAFSASMAIAIVGCAALDDASLTQELTIADSWPQAGFDSARSGFNPGELALGPDTVADLALAWTATTGLRPGDVTLATGRLYVGSENNTVYAFDAFTGARLWRGFVSSNAWSAPVAAFGNLYSITDDGTLYAFRASTGAQLWTADLGGAVNATLNYPMATGGVIYAAGPSGVLAFDPAGCGAPTCAPLWRGVIRTGPTYGVAAGQGLVFALGRSVEDASGTDLHAFPLAGCGAPTCAAVYRVRIGAPSSPVGAPAYNRGQVYIPSVDGVYKQFAGTGGIRWIASTVSSAQPPAVADGIIYVASISGLIALDEDRGTVLWRGRAEPAGPPSIANGLVFVTSGDAVAAHLVAYRIGCATGGASCTPVWSDPTAIGHGRPLVAGGYVFVRDLPGNGVRAYRLP